MHPSVVGFQETKKDSFSDSYRKSLSGVCNFSRNHLPSQGTTGGIFMGVDLDIFYVVSWNILRFSISCKVKLVGKDSEFRIVTVYGSCYEEHKEDFISELHSLFVQDSIPTLIGGILT